MRFYYDLDLNSLVLTPGLSAKVTASNFKFLTTPAIEIQFLKLGAVIDPGAPDLVYFLIKQAGKYSTTTAYVLQVSFTKTGTGSSAIWTGYPSFDTAALRAAFVSGTDDVDNIVGSAEIGMVQSGQLTASLTFSANIQNTEYRGSEAATALPAGYWSLVAQAPTITTYAGTTNAALAGIVTAGGGMPMGTIVGITVSNVFSFFKLQAGTAATAWPTVGRPNDYDAATNAVSWVRVGATDPSAASTAALDAETTARVAGDNAALVTAAADATAKVAVEAVARNAAIAASTPAVAVGASPGIVTLQTVARGNFTNFWHGGVSGKTVCLIGDSTFASAPQTTDELSRLSQLGCPLNGVTFLNFGESGASSSVFLTDGVTHGITASIAAQAAVYVFGYGVNDVRQGGGSVEALKANILSAIDRLQAGVPGCEILLLMPYSFKLLNDGYITPYTTANVQAYTDIMRNAYRAVDGQRLGVTLYDSQRLECGEICTATNGLMTDSIHPGNAYVFRGTNIAKTLQPPTAAIQSEGATIKSNIDSYGTPWTVDPRVLLDSRYFKMVSSGRTSGEWGAGLGYFRWNPDLGGIDALNIRQFDIVWAEGYSAVQLTSAAGGMDSNRVQVLQNMPQTVPDGLLVRVFRGITNQDLNSYGLSRSYPFSFKCKVTGGSGYLTLEGFSSDNYRLITNGDILVAKGQAPLTLSGATFQPNQIPGGGGYAQILIGGDYSSWVGLDCMVFGGENIYGLSAAPIHRQLIRSVGIPSIFGDGMWWMDANNRAVYRAGGVSFTIPAVQESVVVSQFNQTSATLSNISGLTADLIAGKSYRFKSRLWVSADSAGGYSISVAGTSTATTIIYQIKAINNNSGLFTITTKKTALGAAASAATGTDIFAEIDGTIVCNAAGTLVVQFAQSVSTGTSSVLMGSTFDVAQIS